MPGLSSGPVKIDWDIEPDLGHERQHDEHAEGNDDVTAGPGQCDTFGASPAGRIKSTAARRSTTARSPVPADA